MPTLTLTSKETPYSLLELLREVNAATPGECRTLLLEADKDNGSDYVLVDSSADIATDSFGYRLGAENSREYASVGGSIAPQVKLGSIYVMGTEDGLKLNVEVAL
jgi:hypothetical protein